jgi:DNA primase catalytic core
MVEQEIIESIKQSVDLASVIESCGIALKKSGKSYKGFCPFHDDTKTPSLSVTPEKGLWQCFGCGAGGDVIDFLQKKEGLSFTEAVARLAGNQKPEDREQKKKPVKKKKKRTKEAPELTPAHYKLLKRVVEFYHTAFNEDPRAMDYLIDRGITSKQLFADYRIGFANGTLLNVLPSDGETITMLKELGILNKRGREHFYGCATFPLLDSNNNPVGMYGRRVHGMGDSALHLYLPGERKGIFNRQGAVNASEIHLTESILDSLSLINNGIQNTIPCYGTNGLTAEIVEHLKINGISTVYLGFDADEAGDAGAEKAKARLEQEGITVFHIRLPDGYDLNNFFHPEVKKPKNFGSYEDLVLLAAGLEPAPKKESREPEYKKTDNGFLVTISERYYEVRGINPKNNRLKATVKGSTTEKNRKDKQRFHVDTVDFYSARSRSFLLRGLADLFGIEEKVIKRDLEQLLVYAEQYQPPEKNPNEEKEQPISSKDKEEALRFLKDPNLLDNITQDLETIGYTGEDMNKLLCYLAAVSRKMSDPLSVMIQSRSAAGKSCLQDTILSLIPEEDFIKYTRLTDQALFYKDTKSLAHKILAIEELDGMNGAVYSIRTIQSSKKITVAYTGKDPVTGEMKTGENTVEGPLMVFITTTQVEIDGETASRFVFIAIDESREMTEKILCKQRESHTMAGMMNRLAAKKIIRKHLTAQRLLQPIRVINPYGDLLCFDSKSLRARRDHMKYLNLILTITFLFQYQRPVHTMDYDGEKENYILVTLDDIEKANEIAVEVLGRSLDELSPSSRKLLNLVRKMCTSQDSGQGAEDGNEEPRRFTRRDIREYSGWSDFQVKTHIRQLEELEYIYSLTGRKGKEYVYELIHDGDETGSRFLIGLADIGEVQRKAEELGIRDDTEGVKA